MHPVLSCPLKCVIRASILLRRADIEVQLISASPIFVLKSSKPRQPTEVFSRRAVNFRFEFKSEMSKES